MDNEKLYSQELKKTTRIKGGLLLLLILIGLCGFLGIVISSMMSRYIDIFTKIISIGFIVNGFFYFFFACFVIYSFVERKPNAVFLARIYIVYMLIINVLSLFMQHGNNLNGVMPIIGGILLDLFMLIYLSESNQVKKVIPKDFRRYKKINTWIIVLLIMIPLLTIIVALSFR